MSKNYELQVCEDSYSVLVDNVQYFLSQANENELPLIQTQKQSILMKINLEEILKSLLDCTRLLETAYYSVTGIDTLPGRISQLQTSLLQTVSNSEVTMNSFIRLISEALSDLSEVYPCLGNDNYQSAVSILESVKNVAKTIENTAIEIQDTFQACYNETTSILQDAFQSNQEFIDHRNQTIEELAEMNAELEALEVLKPILEAQVELLNEEHKRLESKEIHAFILEQRGMRFSSIGKIFPMIFPTKDFVDSEATCAPDPIDDSQIVQNEEMLKSKPKKGDLETREKQPEQEVETQEKTIEKIWDAFKETGNNFTTAASHEQTSITSYNKRLEELTHLRHKMAQQDAENKAKIAKYNAKIASSNEQKKDLDMKIQSLAMSIVSMRHIVTILNETILFWKGIVVCCETLAVSNLTVKIVETEPIIESRFYEKRLFIKQFLLYLTQWQALRLISNTYVDNMDTVCKSLVEVIV